MDREKKTALAETFNFLCFMGQVETLSYHYLLLHLLVVIVVTSFVVFGPNQTLGQYWTFTVSEYFYFTTSHFDEKLEKMFKQDIGASKSECY